MHARVLVVGAGPVGLTMAAELARYGIPVRIVDKAPHRSDRSKALVLWSRTLELLDRTGCGGSFLDAGHEVAAVNITAGAKRIAHVDLASVATPHPYALMLPQSETERLLEAHLQGLGVAVERQVEFVDLMPGSSEVAVTLRRPGGAVETLTVEWLIGCDGAHSAVRHAIGATFDGETLPSQWILADVRLGGLATPPSEMDMYWHADGVLALFPITPDRYRIIADLGATRDDAPVAEPTLADVQALVDRRGPGGVTVADPIWLSAFRINERMVASYRSGHVFLAGDAAHIHSPAGGQGMNTGMQDACNLAWKLALVCHGTGMADTLLDSYSIERHAVGRQVLDMTGRATSLAIVKSPVWQSVRNHVASLVFGLAPFRQAMTSMLSELSVGYPQSPLTVAGAGHGGPVAGTRAPIRAGDVPVGAGDRPRFALFAADASGAAVPARHRDLLEPACRPPFAENGIWLVRPDGYVALAAGRDDGAAIGAYLDRLRPGHPQRS